MTTALYRRYRPETFADVIGQEHVTEPLMQALRTQRVGHAYLFSGPRGCGKTTSARILARCLNCAQGPTPTPCGSCDSCVALARGGPGSVDVIEIDAASHGGVDDARDLRERASYGPAQSRYKVYIIDEAHMVTPQGFNALLKIVEEPPEHVKFVFATTEPEKVIGTIRSRTHHYPFRLVPPAKLTAYMESLCVQERIAVAPGVLGFVTRAGGGSVRDSLSVLDQLIAGSGPEGLTYEGAASLLGFTSVELLDATIDALAARDSAAVFGQVDKVIESGQDPRRFAMDLLERLRDLIIVAAIPDGVAQVLRGVPEDQLDRMRGQQSRFGAGELSRAADILAAGITEMTGATSPRLQLELMCARVLLPAASGEQGYAARLDRIERRLDLASSGSATLSPEVAAAVNRPGMPPVLTRAVAASAPMPPAMPPAAAAPSVPRPPARAGAGGIGTQGVASAPDAAASGGASAGGASAGGPPSGAQAARAAARAAQSGQAAPEAPAASTQGAAAASAVPAAAAASATSASTAAADPAAAAASAAADVVEVVEVVRTPSGLDIVEIRRVWPEVLARVYSRRRVTWTFVSQHASVLDYDGERLVLGIATTGLTNTFRAGNHAEVVRQALIDEIGLDVRVEGIAAPRDAAGPGTPASAGATAAPIPTAATSAPPTPAPSAPAPSTTPEPPAPAASTSAPSTSAPSTTPEPTTPAASVPAGSAQAAPIPTAARSAPSTSAAATSAPSARAAVASASPSAAPVAPAEVSGHGIPADWPQEAPPEDHDPFEEPGGDPHAQGQAAQASRVEAAHAAAHSVREELARAKAATKRTLEKRHQAGGRHTGAGAPGAGRGGRDDAEDADISFDDEDVATDTEMGQAVIERLLGGRVLDETQE